MSAIINALQRALSVNPADWESRLALIEALQSEGRTDEALALLSDPPALPADVSGLLAAAKCYELTGASSARDLLASVLAQNSGNAHAHLAMAKLAYESGDSGTAQRHYTVANTLDASLSDPALDAAFTVAAVPAAPPAFPAPAPLTPPPAPAVAVTPAIEDSPEPVAAVQVEEEQAPVLAAIVADDEEEPEYIEPAPDVIPAAVKSGPLPAAAATAAPALTETAMVKLAAATPAEVDHLAAELKVQRSRRATQIQALTFTILAHVGLVFLLGLVYITKAFNEPPEIIAHASQSVNEPMLEPQKITKQVLSQPTSTTSSITDIITAVSDSAVSMPSFGNTSPQPMTGFADVFTPSMSFQQAGEAGAMMFGQKIEGKVLGVILDVSGSMAEFLPEVIREVDKNFTKSPIVFVNHTILRTTSSEGTDMWPIVAEDVVPSRDGRVTPYWFLWGDLPRKAQQSSVDRLIEIFKTRQNCFLAVGGNNRIAAAIDFLIDQKVDALYIFSDFEDYTDEEVAGEFGKKLLRNKVKTYTQPAEERTDFLHMYATRVVSRSQGRELPALVDIAGKSEAQMVADANAVDVSTLVKHATARDERDTQEFFGRPPDRRTFTEIGMYQHKNFDAVFYGPEARVQIYLKNDSGQYIQRPMTFYYWSGKWQEDPRYGRQHVRRPFLKARSEPKYAGNTCTWEMEMEGGYNFDIELRIDNNELIATYVADVPKEGVDDIHPAYLYFVFPRLGHESKDLYYNYDFTTGLNLDQLRTVVKDNKCVFHLPGQFEDRYGTHWKQIGFERGYNERTFNVLVRIPPNGVRDMEVTGPSFATRNIKIATTSNRLLMNTHFGRNDLELWEGFGASLTRPNENRHRWTKTEAFKLTVD